MYVECESESFQLCWTRCQILIKYYKIYYYVYLLLSTIIVGAFGIATT